MGMTTVIETKNGKHVAVDTALIPEELKWCGPDDYETMVFACDENGKIEDWSDLDVKTSKDLEESKKTHKEMVEKWKDKVV